MARSEELYQEQNREVEVSLCFSTCHWIEQELGSGTGASVPRRVTLLVAAVLRL